MIAGFIVNKFRGDPTLFARRHGAASRERTGWRAARPRAVFSPTPRRLPAEDAFGARGDAGRDRPDGARHASPCRCCRASPISTISIRCGSSPACELVLRAPRRAAAGDADLVILPGSKATIADLAALRGAGLGHRPHRRMRGAAGACSASAAATRCWAAASPTRTASRAPPATVEGLGLLDVDDGADRRRRRCVAVTGAHACRRRAVRRLRNACRRDRRSRTASRPLLRFADGRPDGAMSARWPRRRRLCAWSVRRRPPARGMARAARRAGVRLAYEELIEATLDALAAHLEAHLDLDRLLSLAR